MVMTDWKWLRIEDLKKEEVKVKIGVMGVKWDGLNDYADSDLDKRRVSEKGTEVSLSY